jgi:hypothetical protein
VCEREARGHLINVRKPGELIRKEEENSSADDADRKRGGVEKRNHPQMKMMKKMKV